MEQKIQITEEEYKQMLKDSIVLNQIKEAYRNGDVGRYDWEDILAILFGLKKEQKNAE